MFYCSLLVVVIADVGVELFFFSFFFPRKKSIVWRKSPSVWHDVREIICVRWLARNYIMKNNASRLSVSTEKKIERHKIVSNTLGRLITKTRVDDTDLISHSLVTTTTASSLFPRPKKERKDQEYF